MDNYFVYNATNDQNNFKFNYRFVDDNYMKNNIIFYDWHHWVKIPRICVHCFCAILFCLFARVSKNSFFADSSDFSRIFLYIHFHPTHITLHFFVCQPILKNKSKNQNKALDFSSFCCICKHCFFLVFNVFSFVCNFYSFSFHSFNLII